MTTHIISRHAVITKWILNNLTDEIQDTVQENHFNYKKIKKGDVVIGILPIYIVEKVVATAVKFYNFEIIGTKTYRLCRLSLGN